jgi:hypothetical protein
VVRQGLFQFPDQLAVLMGTEETRQALPDCLLPEAVDRVASLDTGKGRLLRTVPSANITAAPSANIMPKSLPLPSEKS